MHHLLDVCSGIERTDLERWSRDRTQPLMMSVRLCLALVLGLMRLLVWLLMDRLVKISSLWDTSANVWLFLPSFLRKISHYDTPQEIDHIKMKQNYPRPPQFSPICHRDASPSPKQCSPQRHAHQAISTPQSHLLPINKVSDTQKEVIGDKDNRQESIMDLMT